MNIKYIHGINEVNILTNNLLDKLFFLSIDTAYVIIIPIKDKDKDITRSKIVNFTLKEYKNSNPCETKSRKIEE
jgi:hypothetical protein